MPASSRVNPLLQVLHNIQVCAVMWERVYPRRGRHKQSKISKPFTLGNPPSPG
ncbi:hypothetical protein RK21_04819 [Pseudomonas plecoglossicida]|nr:hypothetical protein RK21_04819 [Pseudomonas plecoglossicida]